MKKTGRPKTYNNLKMLAFKAELEDIEKFKKICTEGLIPHNVILRNLMKSYIEAYENENKNFEYDPGLGELNFD